LDYPILTSNHLLAYPPFFDLFEVILYRKSARSPEESIRRRLFRSGRDVNLIEAYARELDVGSQVSYFLLPLFLLDQMRLRLERLSSVDDDAAKLTIKVCGDSEFGLHKWLGG
jgi:hypothetical protein